MRTFFTGRAFVPILLLGWFGLLLGLINATAAEVGVASIQAPVVRVLLSVSAAPVNLACAGRTLLQDAATRSGGITGAPGKIRVFRVGAQVHVGTFAATSVRIQPIDGKRITLNGKAYPGAIQISGDAGGNLWVVNVVDLESYVAGVIGEEIGYSAPAEAQKAQAIAARTYAVARARDVRAQYPREVFDLYADTRSQVYGGDCGTERVWQAVWATRGQVMTDAGTVFPSYYHSSCGGCTEAVEEVFPAKKKYGTLGGGVRCTWCAGAKRRDWSVWVPEWRLRTRLLAAGYKVGAVQSVQTVERSPTGRSGLVQIVFAGATRNASIKLDSAVFRSLVGDELRSTNFRIIPGKGGFRFEGEGWGHGVGLCQEGAIGQARQGRNCGQILVSYYPGHALGKAYGQ